MFSIKSTIKIICLSLGLTCMSVSAGSPGGKSLIVMPLGQGIQYKSKIDSFFEKSMGENRFLSCEVSRAKKIRKVSASVSAFYLDYYPDKITSELIEKSLHDKDVLTVVRKNLRAYRDDIITSDDGINGLLGYDVKDNTIEFYGIASDPIEDTSNGIYKSSLNVLDLNNEQKLADAICMSIANIPTTAP